MKRLSATLKGLITGSVMVLLSLGIYYYRGNFENGLQYLVYALYVAGIIWTLVSYTPGTEETMGFKNYFSQGFKCFIVVTLMMVVFTWVFLKLNPGMETTMAESYRADLIKKGNYTPAEIDNMIVTARQYYVVLLTSIAIFGYLVIGAVITVIASLFLSRSKKNQ